MARHCANAAFLAERLVAHPAVAAVHWPGLASHPDGRVARRLLSGYGGMVAFDVAGGREAGLRFITALRLAAMAPSLGGVETLVLHPASTSHRQLDAAGLSAAGIGEGSIRVSVGLEHPDLVNVVGRGRLRAPRIPRRSAGRPGRAGRSGRPCARSSRVPPAGPPRARGGSCCEMEASASWVIRSSRPGASESRTRIS